jgi:hypothetical protein
VTKLVYKVLKHDGGWAYQADGTFSESYPTHDAALAAARRAAKAQSEPNERTSIEYEDAAGHWHQEVSEGGDHPDTTVQDS